MNEYRGPPAFFLRSASKLCSRFHSSSTPCSSSGRSNDDPTGVNRVFSFVAAISLPLRRRPVRSCAKQKRRPAPGTARAVVTPELARLRVPTHRFFNGVALRPGLVASRLSSGGIGVDRPSNACADECTDPICRALRPPGRRHKCAATMMILDLYMLCRYTCDKTSEVGRG